MAHILVAEDDAAINDLITMNLSLTGHSWVKARNGPDAARLLNENNFDLCLLDLTLPGKDGLEIISERKNRAAPIIIITARASLPDRVRGFNSGCDDYIIKPFDIPELLARVNAVLRRAGVAETFILDAVTVKLASREATKNGKRIELTPKEFDLLEVLILNRNRALSREKLLESAWGFDFLGDTRTVDSHIAGLRKKLEWDGRIKTVYKTGYRLEA